MHALTPRWMQYVAKHATIGRQTNCTVKRHLHELIMNLINLVLIYCLDSYMVLYRPQ